MSKYYSDPSNYPVMSGRRIRGERLRLGLSQQEFADFLGLSVSYVAALERGDRQASRHVMDLLNQKLGLSYDYVAQGYNHPLPVLNTVRESSGYHTRRNINLILGTCSEQEADDCYDLIQTYLSHSRKKPEKEEGTKDGT